MYDDTMLVDKDFYNKLKEHYNHFQWISVKDRLPEPNTRVLVYAKQGSYMNLRIDHICNGRWFFSMMVTHWMPLPELPKENNNDD